MKLSPPPSRDNYAIDGKSAVIPLSWLQWFDSIVRYTKSPVTPPTYTVATRPDVTLNEGGIIYVSDGAAGAKFQGSDGAAWVNLG